MKVLIVDDIQMARINMRKALERQQDIEVLEADCGKKAIQLFKEEQPQIVTLDIDMPDIDGLSVLKDIRNLDSEVKIIMITGVSNQFNFIESLKFGANNFLVKPVDLNKLIDIIKLYQT